MTSEGRPATQCSSAAILKFLKNKVKAYILNLLAKKWVIKSNSPSPAPMACVQNGWNSKTQCGLLPRPCSRGVWRRCLTPCEINVRTPSTAGDVHKRVHLCKNLLELQSHYMTSYKWSKVMPQNHHSRLGRGREASCPLELPCSQYQNIKRSLTIG